MARQPALQIDHDASEVGAASVGVHNLDADLVALFAGHPQTERLLHSIFRVRVAEAQAPADEDLPDVLGRYQVLETGIRFVPHFPFEAGVCYCASFDTRALGRAEHLGKLTLEFSIPDLPDAEPTQVTGIFPSATVLPENLLRFYIRFSNSMRRGQAEKEIRILGPDGRPAFDVLYRPPLELWDRSMRHLTILLDPGRLKRWVGPNRELGPPLKTGQRYALEIGAGMIDSSGRSLGQRLYKPFLVEQAVREPLTVADWNVALPAAASRQPLTINFPRPLDWALLHHAITVVPDGGAPLSGRIEIDRGERQWRFTPTSPWLDGPHSIRVASDLEDVCGNSILAAFDRPLRPGSGLTIETADGSIPFHLTR
jgi:hypothetical protein